MDEQIIIDHIRGKMFLKSFRKPVKKALQNFNRITSNFQFYRFYGHFFQWFSFRVKFAFRSTILTGI